MTQSQNTFLFNMKCTCMLKMTNKALLLYIINYLILSSDIFMFTTEDLQEIKVYILCGLSGI